jgi:hypothetical protein
LEKQGDNAYTKPQNFLDNLYPIFMVEKSIIPPGLPHQKGHVLHLPLFTTTRHLRETEWDRQTNGQITCLKYMTAKILPLV